MTHEMSVLMCYMTKLTKPNYSAVRDAGDAVFQLFFLTPRTE